LEGGKFDGLMDRFKPGRREGGLFIEILASVLGDGIYLGREKGREVISGRVELL